MPAILNARRRFDGRCRESDIEIQEPYAASYRGLLGQLISVADIPMEIPAMTVDFDAHGLHLGIQVLSASRVLRPEMIHSAEGITRVRD